MQFLQALNSLSCWSFSFVSRDINYFSHNLVHWAAFCNFDEPISILSLPSWVFYLKSEISLDHSLFPFFILILIKEKNWNFYHGTIEKKEEVYVMELTR